MRSQEGRPVYFHIQQALPLHTLLLLHQFDCRAIVAPVPLLLLVLLLLLRLLRINSTTKAAICFHLSEKEDAVDAARASSQELNQASFVCVCVCVVRGQGTIRGMPHTLSILLPPFQLYVVYAAIKFN